MGLWSFDSQSISALSQVPGGKPEWDCLNSSIVKPLQAKRLPIEEMVTHGQKKVALELLKQRAEESESGGPPVTGAPAAGSPGYEGPKPVKLRGSNQTRINFKGKKLLR